MLKATTHKTVTLLTLMLLTSLPGRAVAAAAAAPDAALAQALFEDGKRLFDNGQYLESCPKFAESQRLDPAPGTLLNLANCLEKSGKTASAWATWLEAADVCRRAGQKDRETVARGRAAELKPRLATLTVVVSSETEVPGLEVRRDGVVAGRAVWGTAFPMDPGEHVIEASAPGYQSWSTKLVIAEASNASIAIPAALIPEQAPGGASPAPSLLSPPATPPSAGTALMPSGSTQATAHRAPDAGKPYRTAGYVSLGVGAAGIVSGTALGILAYSKNHTSKSHCSVETICDQAGYDLRQQAIHAATFSNLAFGVGALGVVSGLLLFAIAPTRHPDHVGVASNLVVDLNLTSSTGTLALQGSF